MLRRDFLRFGAVSILASALPVSGAATAPLPDRNGVTADRGNELEHVLDTLEAYGFNVDEQIALFGIDSNWVKDLDALRNSALIHISIDVRDRISFLTSIRRELDNRFGPCNIAAHVAWLDKPDTLFYLTSVREMMNSGHYMDLCAVAGQLEQHGAVS